MKRLFAFAVLLLFCITARADLAFIARVTTFGSTRHDLTGKVGFRFTNISGADITITQLGRWVISGNSQKHALSIYDTSATPVQLATVTVDCAGVTPGQFLYGTLSSPYVLAAGAACYVVSQETSGGDYWYDTTTLTTRGIGSIQAAYIDTTAHLGGQNAFGFPSFQYSSPSLGWTKSGTVYTTNGLQYAAQDAINDASTGDTVNVPAGSFTWGALGTSVSVNKQITLTGGGAASTTINVSSSGSIWSAAGAINISAAATVRDFTITQPGTGHTTAITCSAAGNWRITGVTYNSAATVGYFVYASTYGLIDHCTINGGAGDDEWVVTRGPADSWTTASSMGTASAVYLEDCAFNTQGYTDFNSNARAVVRFCTITPTANIIKLDAHGLYSNANPHRGCRQIEFYDNHWTTGSMCAMEIRGGTGMVFDNKYDANTGGGLMLAEYYFKPNMGGPQPNGAWVTVADYPVNDQIGVGMDPKSAASEPVYLWHNLQDSSSYVNWAAANSDWGDSMAGIINPDRDYYDTATSFDGSGGTGRGTKAQMLAINMTGKSLPVGYWVTDEGSWNTTLPPNTSGQLYVWNGAAWVLKYTPYTYPHPLQGVVSGTPATAGRRGAQGGTQPGVGF